MLAVEPREKQNTRTSLDFDPEFIRRRLNCQWFALTHHLADHPLFTLPRLIQLASTTARERPDCLHYDVGASAVGQRWDETSASAWPVDETIRRIEDAGAWIVIRQAHLDPDYGELLRECIHELMQHADAELARQIRTTEAILFITSPNRLTTYHIDRECNFLFQISGDKTIYIFDREDREILPETEIERFWAVDNNAAIYKPQFQNRAESFLLRPGNGVHIPINSPHWLQNGDNISISLNINLQFKDRVAGNLYRANYFLRRMRLNPTPPGRSRVGDAVKARVATGIKNAIDATPNSVKDAVKQFFRRTEGDNRGDLPLLRGVEH